MRLPMWLREIICLGVFHKLRVVQEFSNHSRKVHCQRCDRYFAMHDERQAFLPWDRDFEQLYADILGYGRTHR